MRINKDRLLSRLDELNRIGALEDKGVSRPALGREDCAARNLLARWMDELGLEATCDRIGNMFGIWPGEDPDRYVGIGSHLDTVPAGGLYDGALGVLAGLEVIETIQESKRKLPFSLVLINFTNEEGVRFQPDMMGSLAYANPEQLESLLRKEDENHTTVEAALKACGYAGSMEPGAISFECFIELHIEQGPMLENRSTDIGVVEGVQSIYWERMVLTGESNHAGTTPMDMRRDPLRAFMDLCHHLNASLSEYGNQLLTVGSLKVLPDAINVIPRKVTATLDIRNPDDAHLENFLSEMQRYIDNNVSFNGIEVERETLVHIPAVRFEDLLVDRIETVSNELGYSSMRMYSGAGHDAQMLAGTCPSAMIFIPSADGISHSVDEYSSPVHIDTGANVLLHTVLALDS